MTLLISDEMVYIMTALIAPCCFQSYAIEGIIKKCLMFLFMLNNNKLFYRIFLPTIVNL